MDSILDFFRQDLQDKQDFNFLYPVSGRNRIYSIRSAEKVIAVIKAYI